MAADHPAAAHPCPVCDLGIAAGPDPMPFVLVAVGPEPDDAADQAAHDAGRWYAAAAVLIHQPCADELTDEALEQLCAELVVVDPAAAGGDR